MAKRSKTVAEEEVKYESTSHVDGEYVCIVVGNPAKPTCTTRVKVKGSDQFRQDVARLLLSPLEELDYGLFVPTTEALLKSLVRSCVSQTRERPAYASPPVRKKWNYHEFIDSATIEIFKDEV